MLDRLKVSDSSRPPADTTARSYRRQAAWSLGLSIVVVVCAVGGALAYDWLARRDAESVLPGSSGTPTSTATTFPVAASSGAGVGAGALAAAQPPMPRRRPHFRGVRPRAGFSPFSLPMMEPPQSIRPPRERGDGSPYEFYFTRAAYSGFGLQGYASWSVDYPKADQQFLIGVRRLINQLDLYEYENPILLTDPDLLRFPFLYAVEVGHMALSDEEVVGLRRYLMAGGFLVLDDFWGSREWANLELEMARILPGFPIVEIPLDHPVFHCFYDVDEVIQVPNVGLGRAGGRTFEQDGYFPAVRGVLDDSGRLMVAINWNTDLGDAWEWAEDAFYPLEFSTYAYQMGVNYIVYAMTH